MKNLSRALASFLLVGVLSIGAAAQSGAARYDSDIQSRVSTELGKKTAFHNLQASTDDGIVTLTGDVNTYQNKLDAAKKVRKMEHVQGVLPLADGLVLINDLERFLSLEEVRTLDEALNAN